MIDSPDLENLHHSFGLKVDGIDRCPLCPGPHGGPGPCVHRNWSRWDERFVERHIVEYTAAYENPDPAYSTHMLEMLGEEKQNCPRGHICNEPGGCPKENKTRGIPPCPICKKRWEAQARQVCVDCSKYPRQFRPVSCPACQALGAQDSAAVEIGHTSPVTAPAPLTIMVDYFSGNMGISPETWVPEKP